MQTFSLSVALTYLSHLNQLWKSLEMIKPQQECVNTFCHRQITSLEPTLQEPQDPGIADLNDHVQKPTSKRRQMKKKNTFSNT